LQRQRIVVLAVSAASLVFAASATDASGGDVQRRAREQSDSITRTTPVVAQPDREEAFDWADAAIGGAAVLGLSLVVAGASVVVLRRSRERVLVDIQSSRKEQHR
jgi:hypothetical protein